MIWPLIAILLAQAITSPPGEGTQVLASFRAETHAYSDCMRTALHAELRARSRSEQLLNDLRARDRAALSQDLIDAVGPSCEVHVAQMKEFMFQFHRGGGRDATDAELRTLSNREIDEFVQGSLREHVTEDLASMLARLDEVRARAQD